MVCEIKMGANKLGDECCSLRSTFFLMTSISTKEHPSSPAAGIDRCIILSKKEKKILYGHYDILKERYITSISSKEHPSSRSQLANIDIIMKKIQNTYMTSIFTKIHRKNKYDPHLHLRAAFLSGSSGGRGSISLQQLP